MYHSIAGRILPDLREYLVNNHYICMNPFGRPTFYFTKPICIQTHHVLLHDPFTLHDNIDLNVTLLYELEC